MTNREILAELKKCYEYLNDIVENGNKTRFNGQLDIKNINILYEAKRHVEAVYNDFYKTLDKDDVTVNYDGETYYISNEASGDYMTTSYNYYCIYDYITCGDLGYYWYDDNNYLMYWNKNDFDKNTDYDKTTG